MNSEWTRDFARKQLDGVEDVAIDGSLAREENLVDAADRRLMECDRDVVSRIHCGDQFRRGRLGAAALLKHYSEIAVRRRKLKELWE